METDILFKRDITGKILHWRCKVERYEDDNGFRNIRLAYTYGYVNGNFTVSYSDRIVTKSKKTDIAQAEFEMNSVYERHRKKGYKSLKDLNIAPLNFYSNYSELLKDVDKKLPKYNTDVNNCAKPMKAQKFALGKFKYPCIIQPKINGVRAIVMLEEFTPTDLFSHEGFIRDNIYYRSVIKTKEGLTYNIWHLNQLFNQFYADFPEYANIIFDGEIYIRGEKVTTIGGAARNPKNIYHDKLQFVNFDLSIPDLTNKERDKLRFGVWEEYRSKKSSVSHNVMTGRIWENLTPEGHGMWDKFNLIILNSDTIYDDNQALAYMQRCIDCGFEGAIIRDLHTEYKFGSRPATMMKLKKFDDAEFECIGVEHTGNPDDKIGFNVRLVLKNDINDLVFSCTLTGTVNERLDILNNPPIGKSVTVKFYERTKNGLPFHANVVGIRDYEK